MQVCAVDYTAFHLLRPLLHACRDAGYDTQFACADGPGAAALRDEGFVHRRVAVPRGGNALRYASSVAALTASLRASPADLVHTHTPIGGMVGRTAAFLARTPYVVHTFHGLAYVPGKMSGRERVFLQIERILAGGTAHFLSQAEQDASEAVRLGIARAGRIEVIGNGIDLARFYPSFEDRQAVRAELAIPDEGVVAITVARLIREKGLLVLADAAAKLDPLKSLYFVVVGEALKTDRDSIAKELDNHPVVAVLGPRWRRLGYRSDVNRLLRAADLFVLPSYREGLPRSLIEAMASGVPAVASDIPAGRELLVPGMNGLLVPPGDVESLAEAIRGIVPNRARLQEMGSRARTRALERHDERVVLDRQLRLFRSLLAGPESAGL